MRHKRIFGASFLLLGAGLLVGGSETAQAACKLQAADSRIKRVVHIQFDNVHLRRDNPNVPSDLEQMPNLLNFMQNNGVVSGNHHTPLISHTATDILTVLTGAIGAPANGTLVAAPDILAHAAVELVFRGRALRHAVFFARVQGAGGTKTPAEGRAL